MRQIVVTNGSRLTKRGVPYGILASRIIGKGLTADWIYCLVHGVTGMLWEHGRITERHGGDERSGQQCESYQGWCFHSDFSLPLMECHLSLTLTTEMEQGDARISNG